MMAMTTSSSISVNAARDLSCRMEWLCFAMNPHQGLRNSRGVTNPGSIIPMPLLAARRVPILFSKCGGDPVGRPGKSGLLSVRLVSRGEHQLPLVDSFEAADAVSHGLQGGGLAAKNDDLKALMVVEVDMHGRHDDVAVRVLQVEQFVGQAGPVVVVDEGERGRKPQRRLPRRRERSGCHAPDAAPPRCAWRIGGRGRSRRTAPAGPAPTKRKIERRSAWLASQVIRSSLSDRPPGSQHKGREQGERLSAHPAPCLRIEGERLRSAGRR